MIKIDNEKAKMEFGSGDIGFNTYFRTDTEEKGLIFYNQEPREIGAEGDLKANTFIDREDFPVQMIFRKAESIDVVIEALNDLKDIFKKANTEKCPCYKYGKSLNSGMKCSNCGREL